MIGFLAIAAAVVLQAQGQHTWWDNTAAQGKACMVVFYSGAQCSVSETGRGYTFTSSSPEMKGGVRKSASVDFSSGCTHFGYGTDSKILMPLVNGRITEGCHELVEPMELHGYKIQAAGVAPSPQLSKRTCEKVYTNKYPVCEDIGCFSGQSEHVAKYACAGHGHCDGFRRNGSGQTCYSKFCKGGRMEASKGYNQQGGWDYWRCQNHGYVNTDAGKCTVRLHKGKDCPNTTAYARSPLGDVLKSWSSTTETYVFFTSAEGGWYAVNNNQIQKSTFAADWMDKTVSFSFAGDCSEVEFFDEDSFTTNCDNTNVACLPSMATARSKGVHGYEHNCKVYGKASAVSDKVATPDECYECNNGQGCKVDNCINLRYDLEKDILGFYMRPSLVPAKEQPNKTSGTIGGVVSDMDRRLNELETENNSGRRRMQCLHESKKFERPQKFVVSESTVITGYGVAEAFCTLATGNTQCELSGDEAEWKVLVSGETTCKIYCTRLSIADSCR